jgi:hypothetical protein
MGLSLCGRELALSIGLVLVTLAIQIVELGLKLRHPLLGRDRSIDVDVEAPSLAALDDFVSATLEGSGIEHETREKHSVT